MISRKRMSQRQAGFTLIELLVTMTLMSIVGVTLSQFVANWFEASTLTQARTNLLTNAESALDKVTTDIKLSGSADDNNRWPDNNGPGAPTNLYGWQSNSSTLILAKSATDSGGNVIYSDPNDYITEKDNEVYYLSGGTLYRRTLSSGSANDAAVTTCPPPGQAGCPADATVATGVTSFTVQYYDANENIVAPSSARSIELDITLTSAQGGQTVSASYNTRMVFRNR